MIEWLENIDRSLFLVINGAHSSMWDTIMWFISGKLSWIPLYLVFIWFMIKAEGRHVWLTLVAVGVLIAATDQIAFHFFKQVFERYRPSHNLEIMNQVHIVNNYTGGLYGFVSNHAANNFALATFLSFIYKNKRVTVMLFLWASIIAYSRVYLGVHYPSDIVVGAMLGIVIGLVVNQLYSITKSRFLR